MEDYRIVALQLMLCRKYPIWDYLGSRLRVPG
jgi:hypothetical protein